MATASTSVLELERPESVGLSGGRVLVVDDQCEIRELLARLLGGLGLEVETAADGLIASSLLAESQFDTIVSDIDMPGMNGVALLRRVREHDLDVPVILMTGVPSIDSAAEAVKLGALRYLTKPFDLGEMRTVVQYGVRLHRMAVLRRDAAARIGGPAQLPSDRAGLEARFDVALDGVWMAYQPIVSHSRRTVLAYEALLRTDEVSMTGPDQFLAAAERLGRLGDLSRRVRERVVCATSGLPNDTLLFVNVLPLDLLDDTLLSAPFTDHAERIVLEITERASLDRIPDLPERIAALRSVGFQVAVDDLGAGYSGLATMIQLQPEVVKFDMALVRDVDTQPAKQCLLRSMTQVCRDMGIQAVAEGVETAAERDTLVDLGCDLLQGFLYARPTRQFTEPRWAGLA